MKTKKCPFCAETIKSDAIVCRYCGKDLPLSTSTLQTDENSEKKIPVNNKKTKTIITWVVLSLVALSIGVLIFMNTDEQKAKHVVDTHLNAIQTGKGNPYDTIDSSEVDEVFINVLDYKYLRKLDDKVITETKTFVADRKAYDVLHQDGQSYEEFLTQELELGGEGAKRVGDTVVVTYDRTYQTYSFLYDVNLTNQLGNPLYEKWVFEVRALVSNSNYKIYNSYEY